MSETIVPAVVICVHASRPLNAHDLARLRPHLPADAPVFAAGACDPKLAQSDCERLANLPVAPTLLDTVTAAAQACPGANLLVVDADAQLPTFACERLLYALTQPGVLAALPLDANRHNPLWADTVTPDVDRLDALCFAFSEHSLLPAAEALEASVAISAWHGARLATLGIARLRDSDAISAAALQIVVLDHLYAPLPHTSESPTRPEDPRDPRPPSLLDPLRERLEPTITGNFVPTRPGLDDKPVWLHVLHGWGGGAERWVRDFASVDNQAYHLVLIARGSPGRQLHGEWLELHDGTLAGPPLRRWPLPLPIADTALSNASYGALLRHVVRHWCVDVVVVSSLIGHSLDVLGTGLPTLFVIHDHYPLWPRLHLDFADATLRFDDIQRERDLAESIQSEFANRDPQHWKRLRDAVIEALRAAQATLVAPSRSALANQLRLGPELSELPAQVIPHGLAPWPKDAPRSGAPPERPRLRLLMLGRIRRGKGADLLIAALPELCEHAELFLLGAGADADALFGASGVHITLDYDRDTLPQLLAQLQPDAALLLPTVAETFSYTLSELRSLGIPVIGTRIGALAERIEDGIDGYLVEPYPAAIVACVAKLAANRAAVDAIRANLATRVPGTLEDMAHRYKTLLPSIAPTSLRYPLAIANRDSLLAAISAREIHAARTHTRNLTIRLEAAIHESEQRGDWGHALNRQLMLTGNRLTSLQDEHDRELKIAADRLAQLHAELDDRSRWAASLNTQLHMQADKLANLQDEYQREIAVARRKIRKLQDEYQHEISLASERLATSQSEHSRDIASANAKLDTLHSEFEERTRWALALDAELQDLKPRYERMLASASWRLTAPLRTAKAGVRRLRASLVFRARRLTAVARRVRGSLARRGVKGTVARAAQELRGNDPTNRPAIVSTPIDEAPGFVLPTVAQPRVSIIIPVYDKIAWTLACLRSIAEHAGEVPFEVIVVDDGSTDATPARLAAIDGLRSIRNPHNLGFIGSCNAGAAAARGEFVLFLNNDTVVTAGWLEALVRCIEEAPAAGLVGARLVYPDGRLQEAGGIVFNDGSGWNYGRFEDPTDPRYGFRREVDYCSGAAILLRRALFEQLGRFDSRYTPAYYEDTDLAFAVRAAGLKVYVEPAAIVIHFEGITSGTDTASGTKRYQVVNQGKFLDKWRVALSRQPAPGTPIGLAASHRSRKRVLIIDATTPAPDQDSGSLRMVNLMRVLGDLGCQVSFLPENRAFVEGYTPALQALGVEALYAPYAQDPVKLLRERGSEFDLVIVSRHYVAASFVGLVRLYAPQARLAFDTVDLHYLREQRAAELAGSAELARIAATTRTQELRIIREADMTLVVSPVEQALLAREVPGARVEVLSNVHEVHGCKAPWSERRDLVFVGGFQHPPNTDAVEWFVGHVFPIIRAELADLRFHVIGSKLPDTIRKLADAQVIVHGFVPDIMPYMDGCRISVAPLRYGAGVKGKVNMAMSCGLPVVATPIAVEGMHVDVGRDVLVAADADAFAAEVIRLYRDETLWNTLSTHGLANVERHFSFAAARRVVAGLLELPT